MYTKNTFESLTGKELLSELGLLDEKSLATNEFVDVTVGGSRYTVWATVGYRGYAMARYCHVEYSGVRRVRGLNGTRRVPDTFHFLGTLDTVVSEYKEKK